jgi:hypothetical protein
MNQPGWGQHGAPQGYPQQPPPKKGTSGCMLALLVMAGLGALGIGSCVVCVGIGANAARSNSTPVVSASVAPAPSIPEAAYVDTLAQLHGSPTTVLKPTKTHASTKDKQDQVFEYSDPPGLPGHGLEVTVRKSNPAAWQVGFWEQKTGVSTDDFAPTGGMSGVKEPDGVGNVYEIRSGPFKGAVLWRSPALSDWPADAVGNGRIVSIMSVPYAIDGGLADPLIGWLCDRGQIGADGVFPLGVMTVDKSTFKVQCEGMAKGKLLSPTSADFPDGLFDSVPVTSTRRCGRSWNAYVDSKNAFNATIRHSFVCTYDSTTNLVSLKME